MLYYVIRLILSLLIMITALVLIRKKPERRKQSIIKSVVIGLVAYILMCSCKIELYLVSFDSPAAAFNYYNRGQIVDVVEGKQSCMLIYTKGRKNQFTTIFFAKSEHGYRLPGAITAKTVDSVMDKTGRFMVHVVNHTNDYYVQGSTNIDGVTEITDNNGNKAKRRIIESDHIPDRTFFYMYIEDYSDDFYIRINDEQLP